MNGDRYNDERLSAWLDGRLPPEERAEVERLLADSPEVRQEVDELRRVSELVKDLPQEKAPADLHQAVMESINTPTPQPQRWSGAAAERRGRLFRNLAVAAGVALAVGIGAWLLDDPGRNIADVDSPGPELVHTEQTRPEMRANKADLRNAVGAETIVEEAAGQAAAGQEATRQESTGQEATASEQPDSASRTPDSFLAVELPGRRFELDRNALSEAAIGDIVRAVHRGDDSVSVVHLTVIDRQAGLESLRVLLGHEDIPLTSDAGSSKASGSSRNGLVAVYVQSKPEQLSRTIEQMARRIEFGGLSVSDSLPLARLDSGTRSELGLSHTGEQSADSRAVAVRNGGTLEKLISEPGVGEAAASAEADSGDAGNRPVRVIFVLSDAPKVPKENDAEADSKKGAA